MAITRLREALGGSADHPRFIETLPKRGYCFLARVSQVTRAEPYGEAVEPRVAVLIFENLSRHPEQDYFAEGISGVLIAELGSSGREAALTAKDAARLARRRPVNSEAHLASLMARHHWGAWTKEWIEKALRQLEEAMQAEPRFAPAYSMLSYCMIMVGYWGYLPQQEVYSKARDAAFRVLALDDQLRDAHTALGVVNCFREWDLAGAHTLGRRG